MSKSLVLVDIQNDYFPGGAMELNGMDAAAARASAVLESFRARGWPVFHVQHLSTRPGASFFLPVYSHGDWMEEFRFLSFVAPMVALAAAERVRALVRLAQVFVPRALRPPVAAVLGVMGALSLYLDFLNLFTLLLQLLGQREE